MLGYKDFGWASTSSESALKIIDQEGKEVEVGWMGEIIARGPQIMKGYFKDPKTMARKIKDGWYRSGDLGRFDEEGYLYVLSRTDEMVVSGGLNWKKRSFIGGEIKNKSLKLKGGS